MALPAVICLRSEHNNKYLHYVSEQVQTHGLLKFGGDNVTDSFAHFEVVPTTNGDGLVHLKTCYNHKYLTRWSPDSDLIGASADKPNDDQTDWGCTLFKPTLIVDDKTKKARLMHVQLGHYIGLVDTDPYPTYLAALTKVIDCGSRDLFLVIDWGSALKLPKNVAFKGDNDKYLGAYVDDNGKHYLQFSYDNPSDPEVAHEIFPSSGGTILIKSKYCGKFWNLGDGDYIVANVCDQASATTSSMFRPCLLDVDVIALLNMSKTCYCKRFTDSLPHLLNAASNDVDGYGKLRFEDLGAK